MKKLIPKNKKGGMVKKYQLGNLIDRIKSIGEYSYRYSNPDETTVPSYFEDLSKKEVVRLDKESDADNNTAVYFNDFLAKANSNRVRPAQDFTNTNDTLIGNNHVPLSRYSQF
jgi:hypothetical protein